MLVRTGLTPSLIKQLISKQLGEILVSRAGPTENLGFQVKTAWWPPKPHLPQLSHHHFPWATTQPVPGLLTLQKAPNPPNQGSKIGGSGDGPAKPSKTIYPSQALLLVGAGSQTGFPNWFPKPEGCGSVLQEYSTVVVILQSALWSACQFIFLFHNVYFYCEAPLENLWSFQVVCINKYKEY